MIDELKITLDYDSLATILRTNMSCNLGKVMTQEILTELTKQIIESIEYFLNKKDEVSQ